MSTPTDATTGTPAAHTLAIGDVEPVKGLNPRTVDTKSDEFAELVESIRERGLLQPVLVAPKVNGKWPLVAGERRWRAARKAGLEEIPVYESAAVEGAELEATITENVQREALSPVEEARAIHRLQEERGYTQVKAAKALGKSERWVRERLRLLNLPDAVQTGYDEGAVPLDTLVSVEAVAKVTPQTAASLVTAVRKGKLEPEHLRAENMPSTLSWLAQQGTPPKGSCLVRASRDTYGGGNHVVEDLPLSKPAVKELADLVKAMPDEVDGWGYRSKGMRIRFGDASIKAAKAYGCLLEVKGKDRYGHRVTALYLTDPEFVADQAKQLIEKETKRREREATKAKKEKKESATGTDAEADRERKKAAKERAKEAEARATSHRVNLELGSRLRTELAKPKFDMPAARLLAALVLAHDRENIAMRGCYVDEGLHDEQWKKTKAQEAAGQPGTLKVEPKDREHVREALAHELAQAKTPQAVLGVVLRHLIAAKYSDETVTVQSRRPVLYGFPGVSRDYGEQDSEIAALIDQVALDAGVLPEPLREELEKAG